VRVIEPLTPRTWNGKDPVAVVPATDTVAVLAAFPPAGGVTGFGLKLQVAPLGRPVQERLTAAANPFSEVTVQLLVPLPPCAMLRLEGAQLRLKSGVVGRLGVAVAQTLALPKQAAEDPAATTLYE
jgi:hypothetical protein